MVRPARATSNCQSGLARMGITGVVRACRRRRSSSTDLLRAAASDTSSSPGPIRSISASSSVSGSVVSVQRPLAATTVASVTCGAVLAPRRPASENTSAASGRSSRSGSSCASVSVPGVMVRITFRSTGPLLVAGSPICSQMATDWPSATSRARYCSSACTGTPAIGIGSPADVPRLVSVIDSSCAALRASS